MKSVLGQIACQVAGHRFEVEYEITPKSRKIVCRRCGLAYGMHDPSSLLIPWDDRIPQAFRDAGDRPPVK